MISVLVGSIPLILTFPAVQEELQRRIIKNFLVLYCCLIGFQIKLNYHESAREEKVSGMALGGEASSFANGYREMFDEYGFLTWVDINHPQSAYDCMNRNLSSWLGKKVQLEKMDDDFHHWGRFLLARWLELYPSSIAGNFQSSSPLFQFWN